MTVLSRQWRAPRPRRPPAPIRLPTPIRSLAAARQLTVTRALAAFRRRTRPVRRAFPDPFFADPALVEDDTRRMTPHATPAP